MLKVRWICVWGMLGFKWCQEQSLKVSTVQQCNICIKLEIYMGTMRVHVVVLVITIVVSHFNQELKSHQLQCQKLSKLYQGSYPGYVLQVALIHHWDKRTSIITSGTQVQLPHPSCQDAGIQCCIISLDTTFSPQKNKESFLTSSDMSEDGNSDASFTTYSSSQESQDSSALWVHDLQHECMYHVVSLWIFFPRFDSPQPFTSTSSIPPEKQSSYLVFESALLLLFSTCIFCTRATPKVKRIVIGSFIRIMQWCNNGKRQRTWDSQPHIGTLPAGNILLSAAILYAGALPAKTLRVFRILRCATITTKTFFRHQTQYLHPAINRTWHRHQRSLIHLLQKENGQLSFAGDGRADSPGHGAKYGSYSMLEMGSNKVVDIALVQVCLYIVINSCY